jgi:hypothetical protein
LSWWDGSVWEAELLAKAGCGADSAVVELPVARCLSWSRARVNCGVGATACGGAADGYTPAMQDRPPSGISALTAGGATILFIANTLALIMGWLPLYFVLLSVALAAMVAFNVWAARGSRHS